MSSQDAELLTGSDAGVDRIVLNAVNPLGHHPGGFRTWWRRRYGSDADLDEAPRVRLAGRFARRVPGFAVAHASPVVACGRGERTQQLAEEYLAAHPQTCGLFPIQVVRAVAPVWAVERAVTSGALRNRVARTAFVEPDACPILDPDWGQPPFGAQILGHRSTRPPRRAARRFPSARTGTAARTSPHPTPWRPAQRA